jgi:glyoxylase-like metal-dependent hydrolase (beta-lactamase superfamily II)
LRVVSVHPDVLVATSRIYQTTCTIVRSGVEAFVVDSPVLPDELDVLPSLLEQAGFGFSGLLATHGDWDHLLARMAFPGAALGVAETTAARLTGAPGEAGPRAARLRRRALRHAPVALSLGQIEALPVPGKLEIGAHELELHPPTGTRPTAWRSSSPGRACLSAATTSRRSSCR